METQDRTAVLPSGKQQTVTLAVSAKVHELKEILQRCFDQQFLVILDARGAVLQVDDMIPSAASAHCVTCVARFPCLASTWKAFALWCHNDRVVTWGHPADGSDSSKVVQIVASGRDGFVVTWGDPSCGGDSSAVQAKLKGRRFTARILHSLPFCWMGPWLLGETLVMEETARWSKTDFKTL